MAKSYSVIEINGNRYDAVTGQLLGTVKKFSNHVRNAPTGVIDGFTRRAVQPAAAVLKPPLNPTRKQKNPGKTINRSLKSPAQSIHKRAQKSATLMRGAVKKPSKALIEPRLHTSHARTASDHKRSSRARQAVRHAKIKRFGPLPNPTHVNPPQPDHSVAATIGSKAKTVTAPIHTATKASAIPSMTSLKGDLSGRQLERMLDQALMRADAHRNASRRSTKLGGLTSVPRWASAVSILLIVVILGGFFAWQNVPQVSMRLAALRADIPASVPGYTPSGFQFSGPINYSDGAISIRFKANSDGFRTFIIRQEKSSWNSQSLAANVVPAGSQVQTSQAKGTTVYIYGPSNDATWVDKGIKYTIQDQANLTSDQILKIASSL